MFLGEENSHARYQQGLREPLDDGFEQGMQIGFRTQAAAKLDQRLAVVVAVAVEDAVDPVLDAPLQRIEEGGHDDECDAPGPIHGRPAGAA